MNENNHDAFEGQSDFETHTIIAGSSTVVTMDQNTGALGNRAMIASIKTLESDSVNFDMQRDSLRSSIIMQISDTTTTTAWSKLLNLQSGSFFFIDLSMYYQKSIDREDVAQDTDGKQKSHGTVCLNRNNQRQRISPNENTVNWFTQQSKRNLIISPGLVNPYASTVTSSKSRRTCSIYSPAPLSFKIREMAYLSYQQDSVIQPFSKSPSPTDI